MKMFICTTVVVMSLLLSSCEKNTDDQTSTQQQRDKISEQAMLFSRQHDQLVNQMWMLDRTLLVQRAPSDQALNDEQMRMHMIEVIKTVTGVTPYIAEPRSAKVSVALSGDDPDNYWISLDVDEITLAQYAVSEATTRYLGKIDDLVETEELSLDEKQIELQRIIEEVKLDGELPLSELERILTAAEVLKGSMNLWNSIRGSSPMLLKSNGMMKSSVRDWSFWKKLGFVSAADAVGGVLGLFLGGYIVVNGIPVYLPAGATGMVGGAAALSYIAAKMVGW